jgi:hypothetical protein
VAVSRRCPQSNSGLVCHVAKAVTSVYEVTWPNKGA